MSIPSLIVPLLHELDTARFEHYVYQVISRHMAKLEPSDPARHNLFIPDSMEVLLTACKDILGITQDQCLLLFREVPETVDVSEEYRKLIAHLYSSNTDSWAAEQRAAASQIVVINAVISKYNSKIM